MGTEVLQCMVMVGTEAYKRGNTYHMGRTIRVLQSETTFDILHEDSDAIGIHDALSQIININYVQDGKYKLIAVNQSRDWETGHIDDYDLKLVPHTTVMHNG